MQLFKIFLNNENFIIQNADGSIYMRSTKNDTPNPIWSYPFISGYIRDHVQKGAKSCKKDCEDSPGHWCWWVSPCEY